MAARNQLWKLLWDFDFDGKPEPTWVRWLGCSGVAMVLIAPIAFIVAMVATRSPSRAYVANLAPCEIHDVELVLDPHEDSKTWRRSRLEPGERVIAHTGGWFAWRLTFKLRGRVYTRTGVTDLWAGESKIFEVGGYGGVHEQHYFPKD